jgi:hypothetical protein
MGLQDRDYMRWPYRSRSVADRVKASLGGWRGVLATAAAVIGVAGADCGSIMTILRLPPPGSRRP